MPSMPAVFNTHTPHVATAPSLELKDVSVYYGATPALAVAVGLALRLNGMSQWIMWEVSSLFEHIGVVHDGMNMMVKAHEVVDVAPAKAMCPATGSIGSSSPW